MANKTFIFLFLAGIVVLGLLGLSFFTAPSNRGIGAAVYKTSSCGCCGLFANYMQKQGFDTNIITQGDISNVKEKYNIPSAMQSCHTTTIGDYFIEGHMPVEAINKLLEEKPDIAGIAMPGMPSGAPGMVGSKTEDFVVYAVNKDGSTYEFMRI